jgi:adenylosuccinate lyase
LPKLFAIQVENLKAIYQNFSFADAEIIKETEKTTNHDVKAVEYFVKEKLKAQGLEPYLEFVHFGLTSQDINNTSIPLSLKQASNDVVLPNLHQVTTKLITLAKEWKNVSLLARTHGQPASPTRLGKEIYVFVERLQSQIKQLENIPFSAKFGGATGNFNAHVVAYPLNDWIAFGNDFVNNTLGLQRSQFTTQIEHYDNIASYCDALKRINTILLDLCRDIWTYVSMDYFKQKLKAGEIGSSAMPHKVNPIDFENAEGNLGLANTLLQHFSEKLPISRFQRDLTDSTVLRNIGMGLGYAVLSYQSCLNGLSKLHVHPATLTNELKNHWMLLAEPIQTVMRCYGLSHSYEQLKVLTRQKEPITQEKLVHFINQLNLPEVAKVKLLKLTPTNYLGHAEKLAKEAIKKR